MSLYVAKAKITNALRWLISAAALADRHDRNEALLNRYEKLSDYQQQITDAYTAILAAEGEGIGLSEDQMTAIHADVSQAEEMADAITQRACVLQRGPSGGSRPNEAVGKPAPSALLSRLPTLDLPHFDGSLDRWVGFVNLFDSLVDGREDLAPSQKLAYLLSTLRGEARGLVQHLSVTDDSYATARDLLARRYQNVRRLADAHVAQILALPQVTRVSNLRVDLVNPLLVALNALRKLDLPVEDWSFLLLHIVLTKLPSVLKIRFEQKYGGDSATYLPPFSDLLKFLEDECRLADNSDTAGPSREPVHERPRKQSDARRPPKHYTATESGPRCAYCKASHLVTACPEFRVLRVQARRGIAQQRRWCYGCLSGDHAQRHCSTSRPCAHCGGLHHILLCASRNEAGRDFAQGRTHTDGSPGHGQTSSGPGVRRSNAPYREGRRTPPMGGGRVTPPTGGGRATLPTGGGRTSPPRTWSPREHERYLAARREPIRSPHREFAPTIAERPRLWRDQNPHPPGMGRVQGHRVLKQYGPLPREEPPTYAGRAARRSLLDA